MNTLKITQIGHSLGVIWFKEFLIKMKRGIGDELFATKRPIILTAADVKFKAQMKVQ